MADDAIANEGDHTKFVVRHRHTRAHRREAGMVAVQLLLPPALAARIDEERGSRPRTVVALEWLMAQAGLPPAAAASPLQRGRPRKVVAPMAPPAAVPAALVPPIIEPVALQRADWPSLLKRVPDPRRAITLAPIAQHCWRLEGADGLTRLRWVRTPGKRRTECLQRLGGCYRQENEYFGGAGSWVLPPPQADLCMEELQLVDRQFLEDLQPRYEGWGVEVVDGGLREGVLMEARLDFRAALSAVAKDPGRALALTHWLERCRGGKLRWYQVKTPTGDLAKGTLISEPFGQAEYVTWPLLRSYGPEVQVRCQRAPLPWREAWAACVLPGRETTEGLVRPEPNTGCPGHRFGLLLARGLAEQENGSELLLTRSEWQQVVERAGQFGVATTLVRRPPSDLALSFDPTRVPGWHTAARGGHRLFAFQRSAVRFALDQDLRCLIGDEMGLGKTASAVASVHAAGLKRILVVCPLNAIGVWQHEISAWSAVAGPDPNVQVIRSTVEAPQINDAEWVLVNYETLAGRNERIKIEDPAAKNALSALFTTVFGSSQKAWRSDWRVDQVLLPPAGEGKSATAKAEKKSQWIFTVRADPRVSQAVQHLLAKTTGSWLNPRLRRRLEQAAARLARPVVTALKAWNPALVIIDEAHRAKERASRRTRAVCEVCAESRVLLLTGTPIRNRADEAQALLEIILPERVWETTDRSKRGLVEVLKSLLRHRMIRRKKQEVLKELPPKLRQRMPVWLEAAEIEDYAAHMRAAEDAFAEVLFRTHSLAQARKAAWGCWSTARKELGLAKARTGVPTDYIQQVVEAKGCVIVFAHHQAVLDELEQRLHKAGITVGRVDGRVKQTERAEIVRRFQAGGCQVFLGSVAAAGESITLTRAETVIFVELDWVPGALLQAEDRGHRAGQTASGYQIIHLTAEFAAPPVPEPSVEPVPPMPLPFSMPEDQTPSDEGDLPAQVSDLDAELQPEDWDRWAEFQKEEAQALRCGPVENLDEYMITALDAKTRLSDEIFAETSDPIIAQVSDDEGMTRLVKATETRVRGRAKNHG